jgi:hydroxypyruvate reductase
VKSQRQLRGDAARIWSAALKAVDPETAVRAFVSRTGDRLRVAGQTVDLRKVEHVWVIGAGKAAAPMSRGLERILGGRLTGGLVATKYGHSLSLKKIEILEAGHPLPDANGLAAGAKIADLVRSRVTDRDLVFCVLSGGGSALLVSPSAGVSLEDKLACTQALLKAGATIHEMNAVRKHLSDLKGGGLARLLAPAPAISLILSDVVGDDLDTIASGPLVPDRSTFADCLDVVQRFNIEEELPSAVRRRLHDGASGELPETPKPGDPIFLNTRNVIVGSNAEACAAAAREAKQIGYRTIVLTSFLEGDTAAAARLHTAIAREIAGYRRPVRPPACVLSGGETTVQVRGAGKGGRNQEFALHCARPLAGLSAPCVIASIGTDGTDGPTDAAGAIVDNTTVARSLKFGAQFLSESLRNNNAYEFFKRTGDLIVTGPTRTNVMDLHILLVG